MIDSLLQSIEAHTGIPSGEVYVFVAMWIAVVVLFLAYLLRAKVRMSKKPVEPAPTTEALALDAAAYELAADTMARRFDDAPPQVKHERRKDLRYAYIGLFFFMMILFIAHVSWKGFRTNLDKAKSNRAAANAP